MFDIRGEYWIIGGQVDFADGDVGDQNHEGIAISYVVGRYVDEIESLAEELGINVKNIKRYEEPDTEAISKIIADIEEHLEETMTNKQAIAYIMQHLGCDEGAYAIILGHGDARRYAMKHMDWIAVRSNNVELYGYDQKKQKEIANGVGEITYQENGGEEEEVELSIYDYKTGKSWQTTLQELEQPQVAVRANQQPQTTYNKSIFHQSNPKDTEENKYSNPAKSNLGLWNKTAQKSKIIGPGQQLWRGTSEAVLDFRKWLIS